MQTILELAGYADYQATCLSPVLWALAAFALGVSAGGLVVRPDRKAGPAQSHPKEAPPWPPVKQKGPTRWTGSGRAKR